MKVVLRNQEGQAVVEYVLMLLIALSVVVIVGTGFRKSLFTLWTVITQEVAAACPSCPKDQSLRIR